MISFAEYFINWVFAMFLDKMPPAIAVIIIACVWALMVILTGILFNFYIGEKIKDLHNQMIRQNSLIEDIREVKNNQSKILVKEMDLIADRLALIASKIDAGNATENRNANVRNYNADNRNNVQNYNTENSNIRSNEELHHEIMELKKLIESQNK